MIKRLTETDWYNSSVTFRTTKYRVTMSPCTSTKGDTMRIVFIIIMLIVLGVPTFSAINNIKEQQQTRIDKINQLIADVNTGTRG